MSPEVKKSAIESESNRIESNESLVAQNELKNMSKFFLCKPPLQIFSFHFFQASCEISTTLFLTNSNKIKSPKSFSSLCRIEILSVPQYYKANPTHPSSSSSSSSSHPHHDI